MHKYASEYVLEFSSIDRFLFRISDQGILEQHVAPEVFKRLDDCHIYILGKRPRISLQPASIVTTDDFLTFNIEYRLRGILKESPVHIPRRVIPPDEVVFEASSYPHRELISRDVNGQIVAETVLANFVDFIPDMETAAKDIEVLYVGKGLRKSAKDRLANHSTLQKILADINSNDPDAELSVLVYRFKYRKHGLQFISVPVEITGRLAAKHEKKCRAFRPSLEIQVSLIEASIISYFKTDRFNVQYLDWPNRAQKILKAVYKADFAAMETVIDNTQIGGQRLYSSRVPPQSVHNILVDFRQFEGREPFIPPH